jgi:hypothetical protein
MKSIFKSKTFWLAILQAIAGAIVVFGTAYPTVGWFVIAKSLVDITLRYLTNTAIQ